MDQLAAYSSDSDEDGNEAGNSNTDDKNIASDKGNKTSMSSCWKQKCFEDKQSDNSRGERTGQVESAGINFFGISSSKTQVTPGETELSDGEEQQRRIHIYGNSVELPQGDFWRDFSEAEIPTDGLKSDADSGKAHKRKFESPDRAPRHFVKRQASDTAVAVRQEQADVSARTSHDYHSPNNNFVRSLRHVDHCHLRTETDRADPLPTDPKVKVYTVHPKISPHLNRHQGNRCACKESHRWPAHTGAINRIAWCSNPSFSHLILSASMDKTVRVWNAWGQQQACVRTLTTHSKAVRDAQWSGDGRRILSCSYDRTASITDVHTGQCQLQLEHSGYVSTGKFHPVSPHLVTTGTNDCIQVWDIRHPEVPVRILTHKEELGQVQDLMFSHDGQELFSCGDVVTKESSDRTILAWDFRTGVVLSNQIFQERYTVTRLCLHPSHPQFLAQTQAGYAALFSTQRPYKMNKNKRFEGHKSAGYNIGLSLSQDGSLVYSGSSDGKLHCYNFNNCKKIRTIGSGEVLLDVAAHPVLPSVVAGATWDGDIVLFH